MKFSAAVVALSLAVFLPLAGAGEIKPYSQAEFDKAAARGKPALVAVHASWCPTCKAQKPIVDGLMGRPAYKDVTTYMVDFDTAKPLLRKYKVGMQSTLIAFKGGKEVGRTVGDTTPAGIEALVKKTVD